MPLFDIKTAVFLQLCLGRQLRLTVSSSFIILFI